MPDIMRTRNIVNARTIALWLVSIIIALFIATVPGIVHADEYSCGAYGASSYSDSQCGASAESGSATEESGGLLDTGNNLLFVFSGAAILIAISGTVYLIARKKPAKS